MEFKKGSPMIEQVKSLFGDKSTGIKLNPGEFKSFNKPTREIKFCEAVSYSFNVPVEIDGENLGCSGARRSFGFDHNDKELSKIISQNTQIPVSYIKEGLNNIPVIKTPINNVILGVTGEMENEITPDIYISYTRPENIMSFMHQAARMKIQPFVPPYSLHSICGNVFSRAYENNQISVSFGCPESRKFGGVQPEEAIIGIPYNLLNLFLNIGHGQS
jgi:uncharacterized protein (DUF169 family)